MQLCKACSLAAPPQSEPKGSDVNRIVPVRLHASEAGQQGSANTVSVASQPESEPKGSDINRKIALRLHASEAGQQKDTSQQVSVDELKIAVEKLVCGQNSLTTLLEGHYQKLCAKLDETFTRRTHALHPGRSCIHRSQDSLVPPQASTHMGSQGTNDSNGKSVESVPMDLAQAVVLAGPSEYMAQGAPQSVRLKRAKSAIPKKKFERSPTLWWKRDMSVAQTSTAKSSRRDNLHYKVKKVVDSRMFEKITGIVIVVNLMVLFAQLQWQSCEAAFAIGRSDDDCGWSNRANLFRFVEYAFNSWYMLELLLRIYVFRWKFFRDAINFVDFIVLGLTFVQMPGMPQGGAASLRFLRVLRALRVVRVIRLLLAFRELNILLKTLSISFLSLSWSMCLLGAIVWSSGLLVMQLLDGFIQDDTQNFELRKNLYMDFGTPLRAVYTMFVATFSTMWVTRAREMIENVNPFLSIFWVLYVVAVNFAVIRVIAALFLKQTMDVASHDSERRAMDRQKEKEKFAVTLHAIFTNHDTDEDGKISRNEFEDMMIEDSVLAAFGSLELDEEEVRALFEVMSSDDGHADYEEFLTGALKMKSSARTFDAIQILHELGSLRKSIHALHIYCGLDDEFEFDPDHDPAYAHILPATTRKANSCPV